MLTDATGHPIIFVPSTGYCNKLHWRLQAKGRLPMWVVYRPTTLEYPGKWCARMHIALPEPKATRFVAAHDTLQDLRGMLPRGLFNIGRQPEDVPEIEEVWI